MDSKTAAARWQPVLWVALLTLLIIGPWLRPGYIFGTDFPGPRYFRFPDSLTSYAALQATLAVAASVIPGEVVGKLVVFACIFTAGLTAYLAVPIRGFLPKAAASAIYVFNPFVYDRLAYGQLTVLAGYAVLPWMAASVRAVLLGPSVVRSVVLAVAMTVIAALDIHLAFVAALLAVSLVISHALFERHGLWYWARAGACLVLATVVAILASLYWLVPLLTGNGPEAATLKSIGVSDLNAFRTNSDPRLGLFPNVFALYGFWAESTGRFTSMKQFAPIWPLVLVVLLALCVVAIGVAIRGSKHVSSESLRPWVLGLTIASVVAAALDAGVADPHVATVVHWLNWAFPPYRGMRDSAKWAALIALLYSQLVPIAVATLLGSLNQRIKPGHGRELALACVMALVLALPLYYGNGLLYGMHGQIQASAYPPGWYAVDRILVADPNPGRAVFLPWHGYMGLSFVRNANPVVGSPAPFFFSIPTVVSHDLEIPGIAPPSDPDEVAMSGLVATGDQGNWASGLATRHIKYLILARELDWQKYGYLNGQPNLEKVGDYGALILYRNLLWRAE